MAFLLMFLATLAGGWLFPWWWPALIGYAAGFWLGGRNALSKRPLRNGASAFVAGFSGTAAAWLVLAAFMDWRNRHVLSARVADLMDLPSHWLLLAVTAAIGGLLGGMAAWAGQALRAWLSLRRRADGLEPA